MKGSKDRPENLDYMAKKRWYNQGYIKENGTVSKIKKNSKRESFK